MNRGVSFSAEEKVVMGSESKFEKILKKLILRAKNFSKSDISAFFDMIDSK